MKFFLLRKAQKHRFWASRNCEMNSSASARSKWYSMVQVGVFLPVITCSGPKRGKKDLRWCRQRRPLGTDEWKQFVFTNACRFKLRKKGHGLGPQKSERCIARYLPPTIDGRFVLGKLLLTMGQWASSKHPKMQFVGLYPLFGRIRSPVFPGMGTRDGWWQCSNSSLPCCKWMAVNLWRGQRRSCFWTPLKMFELSSKLSYGAWHLSFRISRVHFASFGTQFPINWVRNCTSRCQNVMRNAFRTQACKQKIDIMVVLFF